MRAITTRFYNKLDGIANYVTLLGELRLLGGSPRTAEDEGTDLGRASISVRDRLGAHTDWETISLDGCVLSIAAEFELTARNMAEWVAREICARVPTYQELPPKFRKQNLRQIGSLLRMVGKARVSSIDHVQVLADYTTSMSAGAPVVVFSEGFAMHDHNLRATELSELYGRCVVTELWRRLSTNPWLAAHFGATSTHLTERLARDKLDAFMDYRNEIAHRGMSYQTLGPTIVLDFVVYFRLLVGALSLVLDAHVRSYP
jgi:hypothetical protein